MDYFYQQVLQKDVSRRIQVGQDLINYLNDPERSPDVEQDKPRLDKTVDELTGWVNASNFKVSKSSHGTTAVCTAAVLPGVLNHEYRVILGTITNKMRWCMV